MTEDPDWPRASSWLAAASASPRLVVAGVPLDRTSISPSGAAATPGAIRAALRRFATHHAGLGVDLQDVPVLDAGDLDVADLVGQQALETVQAGVRALPDAELLVLLGGDNALTRPALRARLDLARAGLLTLDAHHDVRGLHDGPTNGTPVRGLVQDGLAGSRIVQVGIGELTNSAAHARWCAAQGVQVVLARDARPTGPVVRAALDRLGAHGDVYVDLDVDVVDRAFVPGCPGARPGGLLPGDLLAAAVEAGRHPAVRVVDIVEVDATRDPTGTTVDLAALCLLSVAAGLAARSGAGPTAPWTGRPARRTG